MNIVIAMTPEEMEQELRELSNSLKEQHRYCEASMILEYIRRYNNMAEYIDEIKTEKSEAKLKAIITYCEGVNADFPEVKIWIDNIVILAKGE